MRTILTCVAILACAACNRNEPAPAAAPDIAAETQAIEKAEQAQLAAITARDEAGSTGVYAEDAVFVDDHGNASRGRAAIVTSFTTPTTAAVDYDLAWRNERRKLSGLLARTPTVVDRR